MVGLWYDENTEPDMIGKCNNYDETMDYKLNNEPLNGVITPFVVHVLLLHVGLSWIVENKKHLKFDIEQKCVKWIKNGLW